MNIAWLGSRRLVQAGQRGRGARRETSWYAQHRHALGNAWLGALCFGQEIFDDRKCVFRRVFHNPVADVGQAMHLRLRPGRDKSLQAIRPEAPIAHAPDRARWARRQRSFNARSISASVCHVGWYGSAGNVSHKSVHGPAIRPRVVRRQVPGRDAGLQPRLARKRHPQRRPAEKIRTLHRQPPNQRNAARPNSPRNISRRKRARVEQHDSFKPLRHAQHRPQPNRAAPILRDERHALQPKSLDERNKIVDVIDQAAEMLPACRSVRNPDDPAQRSDNSFAVPRSNCRQWNDQVGLP